MKRLLATLLCLVPALPLTAAEPEGDTAQLPPLWQLEEQYTRARMILEDRNQRNVSEVPQLLERCAAEGYVPAQRLLLEVYEGRFKGLEAQAEKAEALALSLANAEAAPADPAREEMRIDAMFRYALYCEKGIGRKASATEAFQWMQKAAALGLPRARVELARYLMYGKGHEAAPRRALRLLLDVQEEAPETRNLYFYLGTLCAQGLGLKRRNWRMAMRYYERGAELRDARAANNLGVMYERGIVVERNTAKALRYYKLAADLGNRSASANWQRLAYKSGMRSDARAERSIRERIDNAKLRVIEALPLSPARRESLSAPLRRKQERQAAP